MIFRTIKYFLKNKKALTYAIIMCTIGTACGIVTPILNKYLQEKIIANKDLAMFWVSTLIIIIVNLASLLSNYFNTKVFINCGVDITTQLRQKIVAKNVFNSKHKSNVGDMVLCSTGFMEETNSLFISYISLVFDATLKLLFYLPFFFIYGKQLSLLMLGFIILNLICVELQAIVVRKNAVKSRQADSNRVGFTLKMYEQMQHEDFADNDIISFEAYKSKVHACDIAWTKYSVSSDFITLIFNIIWCIGLCVCIVTAFNLSSLGIVTIATFIVFNSYADQISSPLNNYITFRQMSNRMKEALHRIYGYIDE